MSKVWTTSSRVRVGSIRLEPHAAGDGADQRVVVTIDQRQHALDQFTDRGRRVRPQRPAGFAAPGSDRGGVDRPELHQDSRPGRRYLLGLGRLFEVGLDGDQGATGVSDQVADAPLAESRPLPAVGRQ